MTDYLTKRGNGQTAVLDEDTRADTRAALPTGVELGDKLPEGPVDVGALFDEAIAETDIKPNDYIQPGAE